MASTRAGDLRCSDLPDVMVAPIKGGGRDRLPAPVRSARGQWPADFSPYRRKARANRRLAKTVRKVRGRRGHRKPGRWPNVSPMGMALAPDLPHEKLVGADPVGDDEITWLDRRVLGREVHNSDCEGFFAVRQEVFSFFFRNEP